MSRTSVLGIAERLTRGDPQLLAHQVEPGDLLGDGVLHLQPRVHLEEVVGAVAGQQTLDGARVGVADRPGRVDPDPPDRLAQLRRDHRRRRLLHDLLMAPLDRAVPLPQVHHRPVLIGQHLHLDVPGIVEVALDIDGVVGEVGRALPPGGLVPGNQIVLGRAPP